MGKSWYIYGKLLHLRAPQDVQTTEMNLKVNREVKMNKTN